MKLYIFPSVLLVFFSYTVIFILCYVELYAMLSCFSHIWVFATLWIVVHQASLSMGFSRQDYWSGLPCPPPGDLPCPGIKPAAPALQADLALLSHQGSPCWTILTVYRTLYKSYSRTWFTFYFGFCQAFTAIYNTFQFQTLSTECKILKYFMVELFVHICQKSLLLFLLSFINTSPYLY